MPPRTSWIGIPVERVRISLSMLSRLGSRCCTSTKAMPVSLGRWERSFVNASRPPAEAPTPTIGKLFEEGAGFRFAVGGFLGRSLLIGRAFLPVRVRFVTKVFPPVFGTLIRRSGSLLLTCVPIQSISQKRGGGRNVSR